MIKGYGGNFRVAEQLAGQYTAVAGDHFAAGVDQHRHIEPETLDAARDLADLPRTMRAWVLGIELELGELTIDNLNSTPGLVEASRGMLLGGSSLRERFQCSKSPSGEVGRPRVFCAPTTLSILRSAS